MLNIVGVIIVLSFPTYPHVRIKFVIRARKLRKFGKCILHVWAEYQLETALGKKLVKSIEYESKLVGLRNYKLGRQLYLVREWLVDYSIFSFSLSLSLPKSHHSKGTNYGLYCLIIT